ncbi:retrovirus-related pol polyprotein from transposon TNT 1-94 [Tanacetum coccineum]
MTTIRLVLSISASEDLHLVQLDFKTAFLHGDLDEDIYMTQTEGFQSVGKEENLRKGCSLSLFEDYYNEEPWQRWYTTGCGEEKLKFCATSTGL